ncbi:MAG: hypothetical protein JXR31_12420, partial [Prolixibacteraceae bacterium]|nr:hypothetical protein [Prolixibacteraceae bacterium]
MKKIPIFFLTFLIMAGCMADKQLENKFQPLPSEQIEFLSFFNFSSHEPTMDSFAGPDNSDFNPDSLIKNLETGLLDFDKIPTRKNLETCKDLWESVLKAGLKNDSAFISSWIKTTEKLMCASGDIIYANEL